METDGAGTSTIDWSEQRQLFGRQVYTWQVNLYSLLFVVFVAFVAFTFSGPFIPLFVRQLGVDDPGSIAIWSGVILGLGPVGAVITGPFWGRIADRIGGRLTLSRTVFGFALLSAVMAFSGDVWQLGVLRFAMGLLGGFTTVAIAMASMSSPPEWTTRSIGLIQSAQILSYMVGPALGGLMADHVGIRPTFLASGALAALAGVNLVIIYREPVAVAQNRRTNQGQQRRPVPWRAILKTPFFLPLLLILFAGSFIDRSFQPLVPIYVAALNPDAMGIATVTGFIVAAGALAATVSANVVGRLVHRFSHQQLLFASLIFGGLGCALMAFTFNSLQFGILRVEVGLFAGGVLTLAYGLGGALIPMDRRASAFGILATGTMLGAAVSPIAGGLMASVSLRGAFVLNAVIGVVAALIVWFGMGLRRAPLAVAAPASKTAEPLGQPAPAAAAPAATPTGGRPPEAVAITSRGEPTLAALAVRSGDRVLLVGRGLDPIEPGLRALVGKDGRLSRLDAGSPCADCAAAAQPNPICAECAAPLPFFSGTFDRALGLSYIAAGSDPASRLGEVCRVTRSGGIIVAREPDWETLSVSPGDPRIARRVAESYSDARPFGALGRQLPALFRAAGLEAIIVTADPVSVEGPDATGYWRTLRRIAARAVAAGALPAAAAEDWLDELWQAAENGRLDLSLTRFVVRGRAPTARDLAPAEGRA